MLRWWSRSAASAARSPSASAPSMTGSRAQPTAGPIPDAVGDRSSRAAKFGCCARAWDSTRATPAGCCATLEAEGLVVVEPAASDRRVRMARLTRVGLRERALLDKRSDEHAASILAGLDPARREQLVGAMRTVERLLTAAAVEVRMVDPAGRDAVRCLSAYYAELNRRSTSGYDPKAGISAEPHELRPPAGSILRRVPARRGDRLRRCQAPRWRAGGDQAHVGGGVRARPWRGPSHARVPGGMRARKRRGARSHRDQRNLGRGDCPVPVRRLCRGSGVQRRAVRRSLVREACPCGASQVGHSKYTSVDTNLARARA